MGKAAFSACERYRYMLSRDTGNLLATDATVLFVMLNPSTADADTDDRTIRRCTDFARDWGYGRLLVGNLYALRATDPAELWAAAEPHAAPGDDNERWLIDLAQRAGLVIAAWGALRPMAEVHAQTVLRMLRGHAPVKALRVTRDGHPGHPLYVPKNTVLVDYSGPPR